MWSNTASLNVPVDEDVRVFQAPGFEENPAVTGDQQVLYQTWQVFVWSAAKPT